MKIIASLIAATLNSPNVRQISKFLAVSTNLIDLLSVGEVAGVPSARADGAHIRVCIFLAHSRKHAVIDAAAYLFCR